MTPFFKSSNNLGQSINTPYFYALSNSNDLTFKPRIYSDNDFIFQSEYREAFENSNLISDFSFNRDEDNTNSHLFAKIDGKFDDKLKYELNIQNVTNDNYLKIHDLKDDDIHLLLDPGRPAYGNRKKKKLFTKIEDLSN